MSDKSFPVNALGRRIFPEEFKLNVVKRVQAGETPVDIGAEYKMNPNRVRLWVSNFEKHGTVERPRGWSGSPKKTNSQKAPHKPAASDSADLVVQEIVRLKKEMQALREERDALLTTLRMIMREDT